MGGDGSKLADSLHESLEKCQHNSKLHTKEVDAMRFTIVAEHDEMKSKLVESVQRMRVCEKVDVAEFDRAVATVIRTQPTVVIIGLQDENCPRYHRLVRDIQEIAFGKLVVVGPAVEAKALLLFLQEGVFQYLDQEDFESSFKIALDRLRKEQPNGFKPAKICAVMGAGGGCGTSTLAVNIAFALIKENPNLVMMDLNLESGDLTAQLDLRSPHSISDFCRNIARMDESMLESCMVRHSSGLHLVAAPVAIDQVRDVTPRGLRRLLLMLQSKFEHIVVDLGRPFRQEDAVVLQQAETIILTLRPDISSLRNAKRALDFVEQTGVSLEKVKPMVNRFHSGSGVSLATIRNTLGMDVAKVLPNDTRRLSVSNNSGVPVLLKKPRSSFAKRISEFVEGMNVTKQPLAV